jgi:GxxExxY protein
MNTDTARSGHGKRSMDENAREFLHKELTGEIIKAAFSVHNSLGCGLLERPYENALAWEMTLSGLKVNTQKEFRVLYRDKEVGVYCADMVVEEKVIVEVKAVEQLTDVHRAQLLNYMRLAGLRVGLLINFAGPRLQYERMVL